MACHTAMATGVAQTGDTDDGGKDGGSVMSEDVAKRPEKVQWSRKKAPPLSPQL
jgi:hypothetical protein